MALKRLQYLRKVTKVSVVFIAFVIAAFVILSIYSLEAALWLIFLPGLMLSIYLFGFLGSSIYVLGTGVFGLYFIYDISYNQSIYTAEEIVNYFFSFSFILISMFAVNVFFSLKVEQLKRESERIRKLVLVDHLTGLKNYGYFIDRLTEERERADKEDSELSLIMIDVDYFKDFNDRFGHLRGNQLLEKAARIISDNVRSSDIVCRYGGEEFAIILPKTSLEKAYDIAERIRKAFENETFFGSRAYPRVRKTVSCGISSYPTQAKDEFELIDMADRALYYAKEHGRNMTIVYSEEVETEWFRGIKKEVL
jgi:diguanylate cyclase (GGDEF)-like protein